MRIAAVPLTVSSTFLALAIVLGILAGIEIGSTNVVIAPEIPRDVSQMAKIFDDPDAFGVSQVGPLWGAAAGIGVALAYALSVLAHELGHLFAARRVGVEVTGVALNAAGGFVEMHDDDRLTAGRLAAIVGAGPLVTAVLAVVAALLLSGLGWPVASLRDSASGAALAAERILSALLALNLAGLAINLLPFRGLDGGHLRTALRLWRVRR